MAKFYGTVIGSDNTREKEASRMGSRGVFAVARSWNGSVAVELFYKDNDEKFENLMVKIRLEPYTSTQYPAGLGFNGSFAELMEFFENKKEDE